MRAIAGQFAHTLGTSDFVPVDFDSSLHLVDQSEAAALDARSTGRALATAMPTVAVARPRRISYPPGRDAGVRRCLPGVCRGRDQPRHHGAAVCGREYVYALMPRVGAGGGATCAGREAYRAAVSPDGLCMGRGGLGLPDCAADRLILQRSNGSRKPGA